MQLLWRHANVIWEVTYVVLLLRMKHGTHSHLDESNGLWRRCQLLSLYSMGDEWRN